MRNSPWSRGCSGAWRWAAALGAASAVTAGLSAQVERDYQMPVRPDVTRSARGAAEAAIPAAVTEQELLALLAGAGGTAADVGVICTEAATPAQCQLPTNASTGLTSDASASTGALKVTDRFINDTGGALEIVSICWWGIYNDFATSTDCSPNGLANTSFNIKFSRNDATDIHGCPKSLPGVRLREYTGISFASADTGVLFGSGDTAKNIYEFTASLSPTVPIADGECLWIEVLADTAGTTSPDCLWLWLNSPETTPPVADIFAMQDTDSNGQYEFDEAVEHDLSFCLDFVLGDSSPCDVSPLGICVGGDGHCGAGNGTPGCEDECCASIVADILPDCCDFEWIQECAEIAISEGCAVRPECQDDIFCQLHESIFAAGSDTGTTHLADDFTPAVSGNITDICWYGLYAANSPGSDNFTVTYHQNDNGLPGAVIQTFSVGAPARQSTGEVFETADWTSFVYEYSATHAALPVVAGECYWISITNSSSQPWDWMVAENGFWTDVFGFGQEEDGPAAGNGRYVADQTPLDDWSDALIGISNDLSFCLGIELTVPGCDFLKPYDTGPMWWVSFDATDSGNFGTTRLGWSSGDLAGGPGTDDQRRCAQPFTLPVVPDGLPSWKIEQIIIEGFEPEGQTNEFLNFEIFSRTALDVPPTPDDLLAAFYEVPFDVTLNVDGVTNETGIIPLDFSMPAGDYWMTIWASNSSAGALASNFAWFTNAFDLGDLVNNFCTDAMPPPNAHPGGWIGCTPNDPGGMENGFPAMLRTHLYPDPGFGAYTLDPDLTLWVSGLADPDPDPADLYNAAMRFRGFAGTCGDGVLDEGEECDDGNNENGDGCDFSCFAEPGPPCCPDCADPPDGDGVVSVADFLFMLGQWGGPGSCDCSPEPGGDGTVNVQDFLLMLSFWGPCD
jgi:cysteine-rich repeat protein